MREGSSHQCEHLTLPLNGIERGEKIVQWLLIRLLNTQSWRLLTLGIHVRGGPPWTVCHPWPSV